MKPGRGRPSKIRTGNRGRPAKQFHMVPIQEENESESDFDEDNLVENQEIQDREDHNLEINQVDEDEEPASNCSIEYAGLTEKGDPVTVKEALASSKAREWIEAMQDEYQALMKNKTWTLVDRPKNKNVIGSRWVLRTKNKTDGSVERRKARVVAKGFSQEPNVDF